MGKPTWASLNRSGYEGYHQYCLHSTRRKGERSSPQCRICKIREREGSGQGANEITEDRIVTSPPTQGNSISSQSWRDPVYGNFRTGLFCHAAGLHIVARICSDLKLSRLPSESRCFA